MAAVPGPDPSESVGLDRAVPGLVGLYHVPSAPWHFGCVPSGLVGAGSTGWGPVKVGRAQAVQEGPQKQAFGPAVPEKGASADLVVPETQVLVLGLVPGPVLAAALEVLVHVPLFGSVGLDPLDQSLGEAGRAPSAPEILGLADLERVPEGWNDAAQKTQPASSLIFSAFQNQISHRSSFLSYQHPLGFPVARLPEVPVEVARQRSLGWSCQGWRDERWRYSRCCHFSHARSGAEEP